MHASTPALPLDASPDAKRAAHARVRATIDALLDGETDWIAAMATVVCELHHAFVAFDWQGRVLAVLDVDSDAAGAFDVIDQEALEALCAEPGRRFGAAAPSITDRR